MKQKKEIYIRLRMDTKLVVKCRSSKGSWVRGLREIDQRAGDVSTGQAEDMMYGFCTMKCELFD